MKPRTPPNVFANPGSSRRKSRYRKDDRAMPMSALKIPCKRKISRRLHKNRHITILLLFGCEIIFEVFQPMWSRHLIVT